MPLRIRAEGLKFFQGPRKSGNTTGQIFSPMAAGVETEGRRRQIIPCIGSQKMVVPHIYVIRFFLHGSMGLGYSVNSPAARLCRKGNPVSVGQIIPPVGMSGSVIFIIAFYAFLPHVIVDYHFGRVPVP